MSPITEKYTVNLSDKMASTLNNPILNFITYRSQHFQAKKTFSRWWKLYQAKKDNINRNLGQQVIAYKLLLRNCSLINVNHKRLWFSFLCFETSGLIQKSFGRPKYISHWIKNVFADENKVWWGNLFKIYYFISPRVETVNNETEVVSWFRINYLRAYW